MSKEKTVIALIAKSIEFTNFSIIYNVELQKGQLYMPPHSVICSPLDVSNKDLILKPTILTYDQMKVVYTPNNVTPHFYQNLLDKSINNYSEYKTELRSIYLIGDIVGYILI